MCDRMLCSNMQPAIILDIYMITYMPTDHIYIHIYMEVVCTVWLKQQLTLYSMALKS